MKKIINILLCAIVTSTLLTPIYAEDQYIPTDDTDIEVIVSEEMTFDEIVNHYAKEMDVPLIQAYKTFLGDNPISLAEARATSNRELAVRFKVDDYYKPSINFYCVTNSSGNYWGISSIYYVTLNRNYNNSSKQFSGEVQAWLRNAYQIEWMVNGDFYNNATQTSGIGISGDFKINDYINFKLTISTTSSSSFYKYCYKHITTSFQS